MHGRRFNPEEVVGEVLIGSDSSCHLVLDLPTISPIHAKIWHDLGDSRVLDTSAPRGVYVNTERVEKETRLDEGDMLWLGPPQEAGSVCIRCVFKEWVEVLPGAPVESLGSGAHEAPAETPAEEPPAFAHAAPPEREPEPPAAAHAEDELEAAPPEPAPVEDAAPAPSAPMAMPADDEAVGAAATDEAASAPADDPFFVGDAVSNTPAFAIDEPDEPASEPAAAEEPTPVQAAPEPAPAPPSDEWAISEAPAEAAPVEPEPVSASEPPAADDFFVAAEQGSAEAAPEPAEPAFIEPEAVETPAFELEPPGAAAFLDLPPLEPPTPPPPVAEPTPPPPAPRPAVSPKPAAAAPKAAPPPAAESETPAAEAPAPVAAKPAAPAPEAGEPKAPAARPPAARRPAGPAAGAPARRPTATRPAAAARKGGGTPAWVRPAGLGVAGLVVLGALGFVAMKLMGGSVRLDSVEPTRVRVGQHATLSGSGFASDPAGQTVVFGDREAKVLQATSSRLEVEVPETVVAAGSESRVPVVVRAKGKSSAVVEVTVFQGPRLHGISPGAAMPGEEVMLAGAGWGVGATVRFGSTPAQTLDVQPTLIRALVPEIAGGPGTEAAVVVTVAGVDSNPAPFMLGHLPVVSGLSPASASAGDLVTVSGRGFDATPARNDIRVGGVPALVIAAAGDSLQMVVPRLGPGEATRAVELRVPGSPNVGQAALSIKPPPDSVDFRFVAEPFTPSAGHVHALLATGLGPAFVLADSGGVTAAARAAAAADRLNAAAQPLRTTLGLTLEARGLDSNPVIGLAGRPEPLLEVTQQDAAAYNEDWTGLRGKGGPVTRARLARWWEAIGRDLVLMTVRGQAPQNAAALAPEGKVLGQLFELAQKSGAAGVPRQVVDDARPPLRDGLRLLGLRVPPTVTEPAAAVASAAASTPTSAAPPVPTAAATPTPPPLQLEGNWSGSQVEQGQRQYLSISFHGSGGTVAFEGGITFTVPMQEVEKPRKDQVHFSVQIRGGMRHYSGQWNGEALSGNVSTDAAGKNVVATFELHRR